MRRFIILLSFLFSLSSIVFAESVSNSYGSPGDAYLEYSISGADFSGDDDGPPNHEGVYTGGTVILQGLMSVDRTGGTVSYVTMDARLGDDFAHWPKEGMDNKVEGNKVEMPFLLSYTPNSEEKSISGQVKLEVCGGVCGVYNVKINIIMPDKGEKEQLLKDITKDIDDKMTVTFIRGDISLSRNRESSWIPLDKNTPAELKVYDIIKTGENSRALIKYPDGAIFKVKSDTHLTILPDGLQLSGGDVWINIVKQDKVFKVITDPGYGGVLGTQFIASQKTNGDAEYKLIDGKISVTINKTLEQITLNPGEMISVQANVEYQKTGFDVKDEIKKINQENEEDEQILSQSKKNMCFCIPALPMILTLLGAGITKQLI
ncbi:MAG: FecR family protein [Candidatus Altiarchaeota archaeon]